MVPLVPALHPAWPRSIPQPGTTRKPCSPGSLGAGTQAPANGGHFASLPLHLILSRGPCFTPLTEEGQKPTAISSVSCKKPAHLLRGKPQAADPGATGSCCGGDTLPMHPPQTPNLDPQNPQVWSFSGKGDLAGLTTEGPKMGRCSWVTREALNVVTRASEEGTGGWRWRCEEGSRVREGTEGHSAGLEGEKGAGGTFGSWRGQRMDLPLEPTEGAAL